MHSTSLIFEEFSKGDKGFITDYIDKNPLVLAQILNSKLSVELLKYLKDNEIALFSGFHMSCSCYDFYGTYACKHIASLYFILVNEIDKNPFILFSLRGLDLIEHYGIKKDLEVTYPLHIELEDSKHEDNENEENKVFNIFDISDSKDFILCHLASNPTFSNSDFKEILEEFYKFTSKNLSLTVSSTYNENTLNYQRVLQEANIRFQTDSNISNAKFYISSPLFAQTQISKLFEPYTENIVKNELIITTSNLFKLFICFEDENGSAEYRYLFYIFRIAYIFLNKSCFIPAVYEHNEILQIFYKPLDCLELIYKQMKSFLNIAPNIALYENKKLSKKSQTQLLLSAIFTQIVPELNFIPKKQKKNPAKISLTFFSGEKYKIEKFEDKNLAYSIKNYFAIFDIIKSDYSYKVFIDKEKTYYVLQLVVEDKQSEEKYKLKKSLQFFDKIQIIKFVSFLEDIFPQIANLLDFDKIVLSKDSLEEFLLKTSNTFLNLGVSVVLPKELKNLLKPKLSLSIKSKSKSLKSFFSLDGMLEYNWQLAIGDEKLSIEEFEKLLNGGKELIEFKDKFVVISANEAKAMFAQINKKTALNKFDILQAKLNGDAVFDIDLDKFFQEIFSSKEVSVPKNLQANLRHYQLRGFQWNINNLLNGFGTILADDMGLGKTVQAIATILYLKQAQYIKKSIVIIVPTSLLSNWENELDKFAPTLSYFSYYGAKRVLEQAQQTDILITTYDIVRRDIELFKKQKIDCLIIDEAQKIKNPDTAISKSVKALKAKYKIALSGTPVENNLSELWSIFDFALPKYLKTHKEFIKNYAQDIEINKDKQKIEKLKKITAPFMLRRLKTDKNIIDDLPQKIVIDNYATMTKQQAALYKSVVDDTMKQLNEKDSKGIIFKLIIALKQICNHPRNYDKTSPIKVELSSKTQLLMTLVENIIEKNEKVLIFTQYTQMGDILVQLFEQHLLTTPLFLKGDMSKKQRDEVVEKFNKDTRHKVFILSLKAGGVGLNLTTANHVIHYDLWFNPAVENQATDRAFRIGQTKKVTVHRFITKNSFEEKIDKMIKAKQELNDLSVNIGENWLKNMNKEEIEDIFRV